eukprot:GFYU01000339.1.p1 GENE.GFYU01000339.1~~GFYU01000339.1.p1  ORF type:complete len:222 (-),score=45.78 GFYU01000339.1:188-766(-)
MSALKNSPEFSRSGTGASVICDALEDTVLPLSPLHRPRVGPSEDLCNNGNVGETYGEYVASTLSHTTRKDRSTHLTYHLQRQTPEPPSKTSAAVPLESNKRPRTEEESVAVEESGPLSYGAFVVAHLGSSTRQQRRAALAERLTKRVKIERAAPTRSESVPVVVKTGQSYGSVVSHNLGKMTRTERINLMTT